MPDDPLAARIRTALAGCAFTEQRMIGGICFLKSGNMLVCASKRGLLVRVGKDGHASALARPHARPMEMGERNMQGYVFVSPEGTASEDDLRSWLLLAQSYVATLPPKPKGDSGRKSKRTKA